MKKLLCAFLAGTLSLSAAFCADAAVLQDGGASFTIDAIRHDRKSSEPITFSVTVPNTYEGGILFASFYTDGVLTKTIPLDVSTQTSFTKLQFQATYKDGDRLPLTPDRIRLFTWSRNNLKPLTLADDVLTEEVITQANDTTVSDILDYLLGENSRPNIIDKMRINIIGQPYNSETQSPPSIRFAKVIELLDAMKDCARMAYDNRTTMLLTSEATKRLLNEKFNSLESLIEEVKNTDALKDELIRALGTLTDRQQKVITEKLAHFFDIDLKAFIK